MKEELKLSLGKRSAHSETTDFKVNFKIIGLAFLIICLIAVIVFFVLNTPKKQENEQYEINDDVSVEEIKEVDEETVSYRLLGSEETKRL